MFATDVLEPLIPLAVRADAGGLDRVWTTEYLHRDAVARALALLLATSRLQVGTGVAYAFTRLPDGMAALAGDVQRMSGGRFALGLSPGTRGVRRWFGADFEPPAPRLREYVAAVRRSWEKDPRMDNPPDVFASALNPIMARSVARTCDGVLLHPLAVGRVHLYERLLPALRRGIAEREGPLDVVAWCITSIDSDEERARARGKAQLAFYLSTPSYRTIVEGTAWEAVPTAVQTTYDDSGRTASWKELARFIPDALLDELVVCGTPSQVRSRAIALERDLSEAGVTEMVYQTVGADLSDSEVVGNCELILDTFATPEDASAGRPA